MTDIDLHIKRVQDKLLELIRNYQFVKKENLRLEGEVSILKAKEESFIQQKAEMSQSIQILKASSGKMTPDELKDFEKHINHYIKEIDHCIGILSE